MTLTSMGRALLSLRAASSSTELAPPPQMTSLIGCAVLLAGENEGMPARVPSAGYKVGNKPRALRGRESPRHAMFNLNCAGSLLRGISRPESRGQALPQVLPHGVVG